MPKLAAKALNDNNNSKQQQHLQRLNNNSSNGVFALNNASSGGSRQPQSLPHTHSHTQSHSHPHSNHTAISASQQQQQHQHQHQHQQSKCKTTKRNNELSTANLRQILNNLNIFGSSSSKHTNHNHNMGTSTSATAPTNHLQLQNSHFQPFSHSTNVLTSSMSSHHSRCSEGSLQSKRSSRMSMHRSRSRTRASDTDTNSMKSHRRPSVDTVSTYLSHESKESLRSRNFAISVNDLLDCSLGSDEVFVPSLPASSTTMSSVSSSSSMMATERAPAPPPIPLAGSISVTASGTSSSSQQHPASASSTSHQQQHQQQSQQLIAGSIVGVDPASDMISRFVKVVEPPQWPNAQPCPMCMEELIHNAQNPAIALSRCQHLMHLQCLNGMIIAQQNDLNKVSRLLSTLKNMIELEYSAQILCDTLMYDYEVCLNVSPRLMVSILN